MRLERRRLIAFGVDAFGAVLFSGAAAFGHRHGAITGWAGIAVATVGNSPVGRHRAGNSSRGSGRVRYFCPLGEVHNDGAVGQLLITPRRPKSLEQVVLSTG